MAIDKQPLDDLESVLLATLLSHQSSLGRLYLACSGGRDSLALAYACVRLYRLGKLACLPVLIHVNHRLQAASDSWADFVVDFAKTHGLTCRVATLDLTKASENHARQGRYQAFFDIMADGDTLLLAHHRDDQCETLLMRLINGAGVQGLSAMRTWQSRHSDKHKTTIHLLRPWLEIGRQDITVYAHRHHLPYIDDPTNDDPHANTRTQLRHELIPLLTAINPKATQNIARSAKWLGETHAMLEQQLSAMYQDCLSPKSIEPYVSVLDIGRLTALSPAWVNAVLRLFVQQNERYPPNAAHIARLVALSYRRDNNHQTHLYWQAAQTPDPKHGFDFCRYQACLYRYRHDVWQSLLTWQADDLADGWHINDDGHYQLFLPCGDGQLVMTLNAPLVAMPTPLYLNKKTAQRLGVPVWLRACLWQVLLGDDKLGDDKLAVGFGQVWSLSKKTPNALPITISEHCLLSNLVNG